MLKLLIVIYSMFIPCIECHGFRKSLSEEQIEVAKKYMEELSSHKHNWVDPMFMDDIETDVDQLKSGEKSVQNEMFGMDLNDLVDGDDDENLLFLHESDDGFSTSKTSSSAVSDIDQPTAYKVKDLERKPASNLDSFFITRWFNRFIKEVDKITDSNMLWQKKFSVSVSNTQIQRLKTIMQAENPNLVDVEAVVEEIVSAVEIAGEESILSLPSIPTTFALGDKTAFAFIIVIVLMILVYIFHISKRPYLCIFFIVAVLAVGFQWKQLYERAIAAKHAKLEMLDYPSVCEKAGTGFFGFIRSFFKSLTVPSDSCKQYHEAVMVDPLWDVNLLEVVSLSFSKCIFAPLKTLGSALNETVKNLMLDLTFRETVVLLFLFVLTMLMCFGYRIRFPWFLASIEPSTPFVPAITGHPLLSRIVNSLSYGEQLLPSTNHIEQHAVSHSGEVQCRNKATGTDEKLPICSGLFHQEPTQLYSGEPKKAVTMTRQPLAVLHHENSIEPVEEIKNMKQTAKPESGDSLLNVEEEENHKFSGPLHHSSEEESENITDLLGALSVDEVHMANNGITADSTKMDVVNDVSLCDYLKSKEMSECGDLIKF